MSSDVDDDDDDDCEVEMGVIWSDDDDDDGIHVIIEPPSEFVSPNEDTELIENTYYVAKLEETGEEALQSLQMILDIISAEVEAASPPIAATTTPSTFVSWRLRVTKRMFRLLHQLGRFDEALEKARLLFENYLRGPIPLQHLAGPREPPLRTTKTLNMILITISGCDVVAYVQRVYELLFRFLEELHYHGSIVFAARLDQGKHLLRLDQFDGVSEAIRILRNWCQETSDSESPSSSDTFRKRLLSVLDLEIAMNVTLGQEKVVRQLRRLRRYQSCSSRMRVLLREKRLNYLWRQHGTLVSTVSSCLPGSGRSVSEICSLCCIPQEEVGSVQLQQEGEGKDVEDQEDEDEQQKSLSFQIERKADLVLIRSEVRRFRLPERFSRGTAYLGGLCHIGDSTVMAACAWEAVHLVDVARNTHLGTYDIQHSDSCCFLRRQRSILAVAARPGLWMCPVDLTQVSSSFCVPATELTSLRMSEEEETSSSVYRTSSLFRVFADEEIFSDRLVSSADNVAVVWDLERLTRIGILRGDGHDRPISALSGRSSYFLTGSQDRNLRLWCPNTMQQQHTQLCFFPITSILCPKLRDHTIIVATSASRVLLFDDRNLDNPVANFLCENGGVHLTEISEHLFATAGNSVCSVLKYCCCGEVDETHETQQQQDYYDDPEKYLVHSWDLRGRVEGLCFIPPSRRWCEFDPVDEEERVAYLMGQEKVISLVVELLLLPNLTTPTQIWGFLSFVSS